MHAIDWYWSDIDINHKPKSISIPPYSFISHLLTWHQIASQSLLCLTNPESINVRQITFIAFRISNHTSLLSDFRIEVIWRSHTAWSWKRNVYNSGKSIKAVRGGATFRQNLSYLHSQRQKNSPSLWGWDWRIWRELGQYHGWWCPGFKHCQGISSVAIDYVGYIWSWSPTGVFRNVSHAVLSFGSL